MTTEDRASLALSVAALALGAALISGCASQSPSSEFPSSEDLAAISRSTAPADLFSVPVADVDSWRFEVPAADEVALARESNPSAWGPLINFIVI